MNLLIYKKIKNVPFSEEIIKKIVSSTLKTIKKNFKDYEISVHLVGEKYIKNLNKKYRGVDQVTDVISFATQDLLFDKNMNKDLGDLFICPQRIKKQAKDFLVDDREEFARILIHGVLHLCGYDHQNEKDSKKMFSLQEKILKNFL
ncbi:MAG TPA: rRNA maturation RNase YbeY [Candidatus Magasanikbacteria bacterium]|jgi:probable rRNA maturation factor|nr:rRNA maturation RNase YbeY [Candidatus Magasanikbacteria bacterium]